MGDGLIGFRVLGLQDQIQIIAKIYSKGVMTCWKIIQLAGTNVLAAFIQIGNIVYPPEKADMLVFKIVRVLFSSAGQQNVTKLRLQMFKKNESAPEKLPPTRIALIAYVESTLPVDGVTKGIFCTSSTGSKNNNRV